MMGLAANTLAKSSTLSLSNCVQVPRKQGFFTVPGAGLGPGAGPGFVPFGLFGTAGVGDPHPLLLLLLALGGRA